MASQTVVDAVMADLRRLDDRAFEWFLGDVFGRHGWETDVTPQSGDGGVDVIASRDQLPQCPPWTVYIQARRYTSNNVQPSTLAECLQKIEYHENLLDESQRDAPDRILLISTGEATHQARITESRRNITVWDGEDLARFLTASETLDLLMDYL